MFFIAQVSHTTSPATMSAIAVSQIMGSHAEEVGRGIRHEVT